MFLPGIVLFFFMTGDLRDQYQDAVMTIPSARALISEDVDGLAEVLDGPTKPAPRGTRARKDFTVDRESGAERRANLFQRTAREPEIISAEKNRLVGNGRRQFLRGFLVGMGHMITGDHVRRSAVWRAGSAWHRTLSLTRRASSSGTGQRRQAGRS